MPSLWDRFLDRLTARLRRSQGADVPTWYHPLYRLPLTSLMARTELDPRRCDLAVWHVLEQGALRRESLRDPPRVSWVELCRVHDAAYLDRLTRPGELAAIFAVEEWDLPVDEVLETVRLSVGGTVAAAREALRRKGPTLNLLGGMHHAAPAQGAGFCPVNDVAVAIAAVRAEGYDGQVAVLDLDAHPPDGTAECLKSDDNAWIGSLSGADWGPLPGDVDETVLPPGTGDAAYLRALRKLLVRAPKAPLTFVLAGGDVRADDPLGPLGLSEEGVQCRDLLVSQFLDGRGSVWLPAGGYGADAWRVLAGTALVLALGRVHPIAEQTDPLAARYARIARELRDEDLEGEPLLTEEDMADLFGFSPRQSARLMGFYTRSGVELALSRYGFLEPIRRLGYSEPRVELDRTGTGDRMRLWARPQGRRRATDELLLVEVVLAKTTQHERDLLFVHWLTLRHPLAAFSDQRPPLPGQEVPGLGMAREVAELLQVMARRLDLEGLAVRPAWFHVAYASRHDFRFAEPALQGAFEALIRDLVGQMPLPELTQAVADGRVICNGEAWAWSPGLMWALEEEPDDDWDQAVAAVRASSSFALPPQTGAG